MASSTSPGRALATTNWARLSPRPSPTCQVLRSVLPPSAIRSTDHRRNGTRRPPISRRRCLQPSSLIAEAYGGVSARGALDNSGLVVEWAGGHHPLAAGD